MDGGGCVNTPANAKGEFWRWFSEHETELFDFEADQERIFDEVAAELQRIDPDLSFEFGPKEKKREFVISASGMKRAFPAVVSLAKAAPQLDRWQITAFRPRRDPQTVETFGGKQVLLAEVQFSLLDNGKTAGIYLFIPGYRDDDLVLKQVGYLLLDETLGEYDVEVGLGLIKMFAPDTRTPGERYPLSELPVLFDKLVARLEGRSSSPS
jgi:hypothetical protein